MIDKPVRTGSNTIDRGELLAMIENGDRFRLVMAQGPARFHAAHIPGSEAFATVEEALLSLSVDEEVVVYCSGGHASAHAQRWLQSQGYPNVRRYKGGLADWHAAGLPLSGDGTMRGCGVGARRI